MTVTECTSWVCRRMWSPLHESATFRIWSTFASAASCCIWCGCCYSWRDGPKAHLHSKALHMLLICSCGVYMRRQERSVATRWSPKLESLCSLAAVMWHWRRWVGHHTCATAVWLSANLYNIRKLVARFATVVGSKSSVRIICVWTEIEACSKRGAGVVSLSMMSQLVHSCILTNLFNCIFLEDLTHALCQQEAGRVKALVWMAMV